MLVLAMQFSRGDMTMPRSLKSGAERRGQSEDYAFKAEETNTGHGAPLNPWAQEDRGRITSA
jgi:hypothetical protein